MYLQVTILKKITNLGRYIQTLHQILIKQIIMCTYYPIWILSKHETAKRVAIF